MCYFTLFGGLYIPTSGFSPGWRWVNDLVPTSYMLGALASPQMHCNEGDAFSCVSIKVFCASSCPPGAVDGYFSLPLEQAFEAYYGD